MGTSIADPAIVLSLLLNKGSVKQVEDDLVRGVHNAISKLPMEFEKLEQMFSTAFKKVPLEAQLGSQFRAAFKEMGRGNFQSAVEGLTAVEAGWRAIGNAAMEAVAKQAVATARVGTLRGHVDVHPSWEASRVADIKQMGYNAWRSAHKEEAVISNSAAMMSSFNSMKWDRHTPVDVIGPMSSYAAVERNKQLSGINYQKNPRTPFGFSEDTVLVNADLNKLDSVLNATSTRQQEIKDRTSFRSAERLEKVKQYLATGKPFNAPLVHFDPSKGSVELEDGNHSYAHLREMGATSMPMTVPASQADQFRSQFGTREEQLKARLASTYRAEQLAEKEMALEAKMGNLKFIPHAASAGMRTIMVDPSKLDEAWKKQDTYIPFGGGGAEMAGKRRNFQDFLSTGKPIESSKSFISKDGSVDFEDGRHRFSVLRDRGVNQVGMTVPEDQVPEFQRRFGTTDSIKNQRLVERMGDPEGHFAGLDLGGRQQQIHPDQAKAEADAQTGVMSAYQRLQRSVERSAAQWDDDVRQRRQIHGRINDRQFQGDTILSDEKSFSRLKLGSKDQQSVAEPLSGLARHNLYNSFDDDDMTYGEAYKNRKANQSKKRILSLENSHRFRFASQNIGFGIDDAIQSYHYGGIGASFRAASNNATAIAGMTMTNPMTAAMTVVGLSVATAIAPVLLKRMGVDEESIAAKAYVKGSATGADTRYTSKGDLSGSSRRGNISASKLSSLTDDALDAADQLNALSGQRAYAEEVLAKNFRRAPKGDSLNELKNFRSFENLTDQDLTSNLNLGNAYSPERKEAEAALKMLRENGGRQAEAQGKLAFAMEKIDWVRVNTGFKQAESRRVSDYNLDRLTDNATSVDDYEAALKTRHKEEQTRIQKQQGSLEQKNIQHRSNDLRLEEELSHKSEIARKVRDNKQSRENYMMNETAGDIDSLSRIQLNRKNTQFGYDQKLQNKEITVAEHGVLTAELGKQTQRQNDKAMQQYNVSNRDFSLAAYGNTNPLTAIRNAHTDRENALKETELSFKNNPVFVQKFAEMRKDNDTGLAIQMNRAFRDMSLDFSFGGVDPLRTLTNQRDDRHTSLALAKQANPQDAITLDKLMNANLKGFEEQREKLMTSLDNEFKVTSPIGKLADSFTSQAKRLEDMFAQNPDMSDDEKKRLTTNLEKNYSVAMREANKPSGHERFTADSMEVGGRHDRELQARMLNNFVTNTDDSYKEQSLKEFKDQTVFLSKIEEKLEAVRLGL